MVYKMRKVLVVINIILIITCSCKKKTEDVKNQIYNEQVQQDIIIKLEDSVNGDYIIKPYKIGGNLIIKYSNLIYSVNGRKIVIPIFKGDKGNIEEEKVREFLIKKNEIEPFNSIDHFWVNHFVAPSKKGEMKKTFHEFLNFYKKSLFKDIDIEHPSDFGQENDEWFITYDFNYGGIPCYMEIRIMGSEELSIRYKSVYEIQPDENDKYFDYTIFLNAKSRYKQ